MKARTKGHSGERELCRLLENRLGIDRIERNVDQVRDGGADILSIPGFAIEVKRHEKLNITVWWEQATRQAINKECTPILAYRQNRKPWNFAIPASFILPGSWDYIILREETFIDWFKKQLTKSR